MTDFPPTAIIEVAEWPQYEKNGMWYARVAKMLRDAGHIDEAIHYFEESLKAQEPDNSQWLVQGGLAIAYSQRSEYEKAIETVKKAQEKFSEAAARDPEMNTKYKAYAYNHSKSEGEWNIKLGNKDKGVENYKTALKLLPGDLDLVLRVLVIYHEEKKWEEIIKMLEEMQSDILPGTGHSRLVEITQLYTFDDQPLYNIVVHAARETGRLDFAKRNILTSMRAARKDDNVGTAGLLQYWLGLFTLRHERNKDRAIHIWESLMATSFATQSVSALGYARILASIQLSIRYFDKAITAGKGTAEADLYIHKLESLSKQKASNPLDRTPEEVGFVFSTRDTTLTLGLLYRVFGNDKDARECFKAHIKLGMFMIIEKPAVLVVLISDFFYFLGIDLLTDEDPSNDWLGFMKMADVLNFADDRVNLDAAYSLLGPTVQDEGEEDGENGGDDGNDGVAADIIADEQENEQSPATTKLIPAETNNPPEAAEPAKAAEEDPAKEKDEVEADDLDGTVDYSCDGPCERFFTKPDPLHLCRYCLNIGFCDDCIKLQKSDQMPFMICDPKHEFYKPAKVTKRLGKGMVLLRGEEVPIRGWLEGLREEWGL
jgi:tetratricopeptide (TPR) repeat protein